MSYLLVGKLSYLKEGGHKSEAIISGILFFEGTYKGKKGTFVASENGNYTGGILDSLGIIKHGTESALGLNGSYYYKFDLEKKILNLCMDFSHKE